jgi:hypothetical protein
MQELTGQREEAHNAWCKRGLRGRHKQIIRQSNIHHPCCINNNKVVEEVQKENKAQARWKSGVWGLEFGVGVCTRKEAR